MSTAERRGHRVGDREGDAMGAGGGLGIAGDDGDRGHGVTFEAGSAGWSLAGTVPAGTVPAGTVPADTVPADTVWVWANGGHRLRAPGQRWLHLADHVIIDTYFPDRLNITAAILCGPTRPGPAGRLAPSQVLLRGVSSQP